MGMIKTFARPKSAEQLAKAAELWLGDAFGGVDGVRRAEWGGTITISVPGRFDATVIVEDADRADGCEWMQLDEGQREHLAEWNAAGRPSLEAIQRNGDLGPLSEVEAAAVRSMRLGEAVEGMNFTPEEVAGMRRRAFFDVLARRVDEHLGETVVPPKDARDLALDVRHFLQWAYGPEAGGGLDCTIESVFEGRRMRGSFEMVPAERKPAAKRVRKRKAG